MGLHFHRARFGFSGRMADIFPQSEIWPVRTDEASVHPDFPTQDYQPEGYS